MTKIQNFKQCYDVVKEKHGPIVTPSDLKEENHPEIIGT